MHKQENSKTFPIFNFGWYGPPINRTSRRREELDMEEDSQPETSINKPDKFKPINWVQWSKDFENYVAQYNTVHKSGVSLSYVICSNLKRPHTADMSLLPQTE